MSKIILKRINGDVIAEGETLVGIVQANRANLQRANLREANLWGADLREADLREANLREADLREADLREADLREADLQRANLLGADLWGADLWGAKNIPPKAAAELCILPDGDLIGYKKLHGGVICKLRIPAEARRSNATGRECRAEFAEVLELTLGRTRGESERGCTYIVGEVVKPDKWDTDRWNECSHGIHFFITREEAEAY